MAGREITLRCPLCGDLEFEHIDFHMSFGLDGEVNQLQGERCSTCGHVLLFLNKQPPETMRLQDLVIRQVQTDVLN